MSASHEVAAWAAGLYVSLGAVAWVAMRVRRNVDPDLVSRYGLLGLLITGALGPAFVSPYAFVVSLAIASFACSREVGLVASRLSESSAESAKRRGFAGASCASALMVLAMTTKPSVPPWVGAALGVFGLALPWALLRAPSRTQRHLAKLATLGWPALSLVGLSFLAARPNAFLDIAFLYIVLEINDSVAFVAGRSFGKHRFAPSVSPNKTWEGFVAGVLAAGATGAAIAFCEPSWSRAECAAVATCLALLGTFADLSASAFKRAANVKDYGAVLGPHGGVLDAYDAMILVGPFWWAWLAFF